MLISFGLGILWAALTLAIGYCLGWLRGNNRAWDEAERIARENHERITQKIRNGLEVSLDRQIAILRNAPAVKAPFICQYCGHAIVGGDCKCPMEERRKRWEEGQRGQ